MSIYTWVCYVYLNVFGKLCYVDGDLHLIFIWTWRNLFYLHNIYLLIQVNISAKDAYFYFSPPHLFLSLGMHTAWDRNKFRMIIWYYHKQCHLIYIFSQMTNFAYWRVNPHFLISDFAALKTWRCWDHRLKVKTAFGLS